MDSLGDVLSTFAVPAEPPEVRALKQYVHDQFGHPAQVAVQGETLVITVASPALANTLRLRTTALRAAANTQKRLVFRIG